MPRTSLNVAEKAHRLLGLLSVDETPSADQYAYAADTLEALFAEMQTVQGMTPTWTVETVPEAAFLPLSQLLAVEIGQHYGVQTETRARAVMRLRAYAFENDIVDLRDVDEDGTVSEAEAMAGLRAQYY